MKKRKIENASDKDSDVSTDDQENGKKEKKRKHKKRKKRTGRKGKSMVVPVFLPPTKEMEQLYKERPKKPTKKRPLEKETSDERRRRTALSGLDEFRTAPFEIDPTIPKPPIGIVKSRNYFEQHSHRLARRFLVLGPDVAKKTLFLAKGNVSYL